MDHNNIKKLTFSGVMAALTFIATYFIKIPNPIGYIHLGDGVILAGATLLGPAAIIPAAFGSALADFMGGYYIYLVPTLLVKGIIAGFAGILIAKNKPNAAGAAVIFTLAEIIMVGGYFITEYFLYGIALAIGSIPGNLIQGFSGVTIGLVLYNYMLNMRNEFNKA